MSRPDAQPRLTPASFEEVSATLESVLRGSMRHAIVVDAAAARDATLALRRLRDGMRSDTWGSGASRVELGAAIAAADRRVRRDGFHAIHDWDGKAERVNDDTIAIDIVNYALDKRGAGAPDPAVLAMLLDYYFLYVLALLSLSAWEGDDADARLDRVDGLLHDLQGSQGSGQRFVDDAATLMLLATSHYESAERAYDTLLDRVRGLAPRHRARIAHVHTRCLGSHLRFGIEATYGQDFTLMRDDNGVDYRWLSFALATVLDEYERLRAANEAGADRTFAVESLLSGLSADVDAFVGGRRLELFEPWSGEYVTLRDRLQASRRDLAAEFGAFRPSDDRYSPLSLFFNFSQNVLKGVVADAIMWGEPRAIGLNDLMTAEGLGSTAKAALARTLMSYARASPDRIRGKLMPAIVYDARAGRRAFGATIRALTPQAQEGGGT
jgi:hypothetical protein